MPEITISIITILSILGIIATIQSILFKNKFTNLPSWQKKEFERLKKLNSSLENDIKVCKKKSKQGLKEYLESEMNNFNEQKQEWWEIKNQEISVISNFKEKNFFKSKITSVSENSDFAAKLSLEKLTFLFLYDFNLEEKLSEKIRKIFWGKMQKQSSLFEIYREAIDEFSAQLGPDNKRKEFEFTPYHKFFLSKCFEKFIPQRK